MDMCLSGFAGRIRQAAAHLSHVNRLLLWDYLDKDITYNRRVRSTINANQEETIS